MQIIIILGYFILTILIGVFRSKSKNEKEYHGSQLGVAAIVCASAGEWLGGTATTGVSEYGFEYGLSGAWYTIANGIGVLLLGVLFAETYKRIDRLTIPGIIEKVFGKKAQTISSIILVFVMIAVGMSQVIAAGKFGEALLGIDFSRASVIFTGIFVVYTLAGGMKAVTKTNKLHLFTMYIGIIVAILVLVYKIGGTEGFSDGIRRINAEKGKNYLSMTSIGFPKISSWVLASLLGACTAQAGIQPVLASKDSKTAKKACIYTALVTAPFGLFTALIGIIAKIMATNGQLLDVNGLPLSDGKLALTSIMLDLPPIVGGLVLAAEFAAILSTVSPIILAAGTMLTKDFYQVKIKPSATDQQVLIASRITTAFGGVACCLGAIVLAGNNKVLDIVYSAYSLRGALFIIILFGLYWKKSTSKAACHSMIITAVVSLIWALGKLVTGKYFIFDWLSETYVAIIVAFGSMFILSIIDNEKRIRRRTSPIV